MNNVTIKKWILLLALLAITLVLVWQAPQPQQDIAVVSAKQDRAVLARSDSLGQAQSTDEDIVLKQRQIVTEKVDLFNTPPTPKPVTVVAKPVQITPVQQQVIIPFHYMGMLEQQHQITLFLLEGSELHLVKQGDTLNQQFQLQSIDLENGQLVWLYLPQNEIRKMSIRK